MGFLDRIAAEASQSSARMGVDQYIQDYFLDNQQFLYNGSHYNYGTGLRTTYTAGRVQEVASTLPGYTQALMGCPPAFAAQMVRALVLSQARFIWRTMRSSNSARKTFGTRELEKLERPWPGATTGELVSRMEWHAGVAGNSYVYDRGPRELKVLRPDWVGILYGSEMDPDDVTGHALDGRVVGYVYQVGGLRSDNKNEIHVLLPDDVCHWAPIPDPLSAGMGMSWITPAVREIQGDRAATEHKLAFFKNGAPQPLDAKVLTPTGWSTMGEMAVGSRVIGSDGKPHEVIAVYPQGEQDVYRIHFLGGASVECTLDHLWTVANEYDRRRGVTRTMTLAEMQEVGVRYASGPAKWSIPLLDPVEYDDPGVDLALDPYLLGTLIGDGSYRPNLRGSGGVSLASNRNDASEQDALLAPMLPDGVRMNRRDREGEAVEFYFARTFEGGLRYNSLTKIVKSLGIWGQAGHEKTIPEEYMHGSVGERVSLLQGLIDADGSVDKRQPNTVTFTSTSWTLAQQVADLVGGLGGIAALRQARVGRGAHKAQWRVSISRLPEWIAPCRLKRKSSRYSPTLRGGRYRNIQRVELVGRKPTQCIGVDSSDHLYATDFYILTHNTPNLVVKGIPAVNEDQFNEIVRTMDAQYSGVRNAYKTLYLNAGADATVVGSDFKQMDFTSVQGRGETRISVLSRVPAALLGISEGLAGSSLNQGNFGMARRMFSDSWVYPNLQDLSASLSKLLVVPSDSELWFDAHDIPLLREDRKDAAEIQNKVAATISSYISAGFTPETAVAAARAEDVTLLEHSGLVSVQLWEPGAQPAVGQTKTDASGSTTEPSAQQGESPGKPQPNQGEGPGTPKGKDAEPAKKAPAKKAKPTKKQ